MPLFVPVAPDATLEALDKALPRFAVSATAPVLTEGTGIDPAFRAHVSARPSISARAPGIGRGVEDFVGRRRVVEPAASGDPHRPLAAQVHVMGLDQLSANTSPRKVKASVWTHFLSDGADGAQAVADVEAGSHKFTSISEGPGVQEVSRRIAGLVAEESTSPKQSELAIIRVPALNLTAVWLKGAEGEQDDVVIPNNGPIAPLVPGKRYPLAEFREIARKMADERLKMAKGDSGG